MTSTDTTPAVQVKAAAGTAKGKITAARLVPGVKILVDRSTSAVTPDRLFVADKKTGAEVATVTSVCNIQLEGGRRRQSRLQITTDLGVLASVSSSQTFFLAPEPKPAAAPKAAKPAPAAAPAKKAAEPTPAQSDRAVKREIAALLIDRANLLVGNWDQAQDGSDTLRNVGTTEAAKILADWLKYLPGAKEAFEGTQFAN